MARKKNKAGFEQRYTDMKEIGKGGMATVYKAHDTQLDRDVAVKEIQSQFIKDVKFKNRFEREAKSLAKLLHPNIIPIYDYISTKESLYYVMAYIEGKTLREIIDKNEVNDKLIKDVIESVSSALTFAHKRNIVHRDIKPDNIFIDVDGHVLLGDFGIVSLQEKENETQLTQQGTFLGTPGYASPEQIEGGKLTSKSDMYSLGVVIYEMLEGKLPFAGNLNSVITGHLTKVPPPIDQTKLASELNSISNLINKMLSKNPDDRPADLNEIQSIMSVPNVSGLGIEDFDIEKEKKINTSVAADEEDEIFEDDLPLVKELKVKKKELREVINLHVQLQTNKKQIDRKSYLELDEKYTEKISILKKEIKKLQHSVKTRIAEVDLMLKTINVNIKDFQQKTVELDNLKTMSVIKDDEYKSRQDEYNQQINEKVTSQDNLEKELTALRTTMTGKLPDFKGAKRFNLIKVVYILIFLFTGYLLWAVLYGSFNTYQGTLNKLKVQFRKNHVLNSPIVNIGNKNEKTLIYSAYTGKGKINKEAVITKKTYVAAGTDYKLLTRGSIVKIEKENEDDYLISFKSKSSKELITGVINKAAARKNMWYFVETESGKEGWIFSDDVILKKNTSFFKKILFNVRRFFLLRKAKSREEIVKVKDDEKGIFGNLDNKESVKISRGLYYVSRNIDFKYYLDFKGAAAIDKAISLELQNLQMSKNEEKYKKLKEIKKQFFLGAFRNAEDMIQNVSIVGAFNSWIPEKDIMKSIKTNNYRIYYTKKHWKFIKAVNEYMFVVKIKGGNNQSYYIWLEDPLTKNIKKDKIADTRSYFKIEKFPKYRWPKFLPTEIKASSSAQNYDTLNLVDGNPATAWITGAESGGIGESLLMKFPYVKVIRQIGIVNGINKKGEYAKVNRIEKVKLVFDNGSTEIYLRDFISGFQYFTLKKPIYTKSVKLIIKSVYPGQNTSAGGIAEIVFH